MIVKEINEELYPNSQTNDSQEYSLQNKFTVMIIMHSPSSIYISDTRLPYPPIKELK